MLMRSPEMVLWNAIRSDASVSALVGQKIYPNLAKASDDLPFCTWRRTGVSREQTLSDPMGMPTVSMELSIYAANYLTARQITDAIRQVLDGFTGSFDNTRVRHASLESESDDVIVLDGSEVPTVYSVTQDYEILWQES